MAGINRNSIKGRGIASNKTSRFLARQTEAFDDGWGHVEEDDTLPATEIFAETSKTILTRNSSPDIPFNVSINPYKGCEHGCAYCFARPSHAYLDLSPGLDFETKIVIKPDAARLLEKAFDRPAYQPEVIALGANTDPYQPVERKLRITRQLLEVFYRYRHPVTLITKSAMIERDLDILAEMAKLDLVSVAISVTTLDRVLCRHLEPRATAPQRRLQAIHSLTSHGVPVSVLFAPVIPTLNDSEAEAVLKATQEAGASGAHYIMLRLPHELKQLFREWLQTHYPLKAEHVINIVREMRDGQDYDSRFGIRQTGNGAWAELFAQRFSLQCKKLGLNTTDRQLNTSLFIPAGDSEPQLDMFQGAYPV